ncbi:MAG: nitroreductase family deazaflavin-dependent oxidoreductase [Anaerolineae bacterium]|nr:nitroreductase family deazaflavin-dependent oxidoreductase [Anaerolineae bacterium]
MTATQTTSRSPWIKFVRWQNPLMKWLLSSPLHFFASRFYMLITVTGRKTGRLYTTPVQYAQNGGELVIVTSERYRWWRNLVGGAEVQLLLRGRQRSGFAQVSTEPGAIATALGRLYPQIAPAKRASFAAGKVLVTIQLNA